MKDIATFIPISKAKSELLDIIRRLESVGDAVLETLDILSDEKTMKSLRTAIRQARQGKRLKYEEVFSR